MIQDPETRELALLARRKRRKKVPLSDEEAAALRTYQADHKRAHDARRRDR